MLGSGTQSIYLPERYYNATVFARFFDERFKGKYRLSHVAPSGGEIFFVANPFVSFEDLNKWEEELWKD